MIKDILAALSIRLTTDASKFNQGLQGSMKQMNLMKQGAAALGGALAAAFSVKMLINFTKKSIQAYDVQAKAEAGLLTALDGRRDIQEKLLDQASELQKKTLFGDEQTIAAAARLAQVLGENEEALKRLLPLAQDFATAKSMDLAASAELIAKTVGSSTNALTRYGITVEGAVGSTERLESAIKGLNDQVGGQAVAAAEAGIGAYVQLKNAWGDYMEEVGRGMVESGDKTFMGWLKTQIEEGTEVKKLWNDLKQASKETGIAIEYQDKVLLQNNDILTDHAKFIFEAWEKQKKLNEEKKKLTKKIKEEVIWFDDLNEKIKEQKKIKDEALKGDLRTIALANEEIKGYQEQIKWLNELTNAELKRIELQKKQGITISNVSDTEEHDRIEQRIEDYYNLGVSAGRLSLEYDKLFALDQKENLDPAYLIARNSEYLKQAEENYDKFLVKLREFQAGVTATNRFIQDSFVYMVSSFAQSMGEIMATGEQFDFSKAILTPIADILMKLGEMLLVVASGIFAFNESLMSLNPYIALAAGVTLIAMAAAIKAGIKNLGETGGQGVTLPSTTQTNTDPTRNINRQYGERMRIDININGTIKGSDIDLSHSRYAIEKQLIT